MARGTEICFIDEPILSAFGSSTYVSVQRSDVVHDLAEVIAAVHKEGGLAGIHCCGNTEWTILIDAGTDVISFDAFDYGETIAYYPSQIEATWREAESWPGELSRPRPRSPRKRRRHFSRSSARPSTTWRPRASRRA